MGKGFPSVVVTGIAMTTALAPDAETTWKPRWGADRGFAAVKGSRTSIVAAPFGIRALRQYGGDHFGTTRHARV